MQRMTCALQALSLLVLQEHSKPSPLLVYGVSERLSQSPCPVLALVSYSAVWFAFTSPILHSSVEYLNFSVYLCRSNVFLLFLILSAFAHFLQNLLLNLIIHLPSPGAQLP